VLGLFLNRAFSQNENFLVFLLDHFAFPACAVSSMSFIHCILLISLADACAQILLPGIRSCSRVFFLSQPRDNSSQRTFEESIGSNRGAAFGKLQSWLVGVDA